MTINEFFNKENIMSKDKFAKATFKDELEVVDYTKMGAIALSRAFDNDEYVPLASGWGVEFAIVVTFLGLEPDGNVDGDAVFKAFVCYGLYDDFRNNYCTNENRARMILRAEADLAELIEDKRKQVENGGTFIAQIKRLFEKIATDETVLAKIDALVDNLE